MSTTPTKTHKIELPQLAVKCLRDILEGGGWATLTSDHGCAVKLLENVIPETKQPEEIRQAKSQSECRELDAAWCDEPKAFEVTDQQRDKIRKAIKWFLDKGALQTGRYTWAVLVQFALATEE